MRIVTGIFIAAGKRSAIGRLGGALAPLSAAEIGAQVVRGMIEGVDMDPGALDEVIIGQVLQGGAGQNPARQTAIGAGIPVDVPAVTINQVCGAGQRSIHFAAQAIKAGDAELIVAGGQDSMSGAPRLLRGTRGGARMGDVAAEDMMIRDGLWDAFHDVHMGTTVETLARRYQISREAQDAFAMESQEKAARAQAAGFFEQEIVPVRVPAGRGESVFARDEHPRRTPIEALAGMPPAFAGDGTITAGNSSGLNDGASAVLVASEAGLARVGLDPLVRIASYANFAGEPMDMGLGPVGASRAALAKAGWEVRDLDILEVNEAFAAQSLAVEQEMGWERARVNPNGGAIALGHPLAGSGNRIVVTLLHEMKRRSARRGLATLCIGGGMGVAICLELC